MYFALFDLTFPRLLTSPLRKTHWNRSLVSPSALAHCDLYRKSLASAWSIPVSHQSSSLNLVRHLNDMANRNLLYIIHFTVLRVRTFKDSEYKTFKTLKEKPIVTELLTLARYWASVFPTLLYLILKQP